MQYAHKELAVFDMKKNTNLGLCASLLLLAICLRVPALFRLHKRPLLRSLSLLPTWCHASASVIAAALEKPGKRGLHHGKRSRISGVPTFPLPEIPEIPEH